MFGRWLVLSALVLGTLGMVAPRAGASAESHAAADAHGGAAEGGVGEAVNPLDFKADLALWTVFVFLGVLGVLWVFAWKPIIRALDDREQHVSGEIRAAEEAHRRAKEMLEEYQKKLSGAQEEIARMMEKARQEARALGQQIVQEAREEAEAQHRRKLAEIEQAADRAVQEISQLGANLAVDLAGKIIASRLDPAAHVRMIEQAVATLGAVRGADVN